MSKPVKIIIQMNNGQTLEFTVENIEYHEEMGFNSHLPEGAKYLQNEFNGQMRVSVKGWIGCETFDSFKAETKLDPLEAKNLADRMVEIRTK